MKRIWWVRHGPTKRAEMIGWTDVAAVLDDPDKINRLSEFLPYNAALVSSDLLRARSTADTLDGPKRKRLTSRRDLREFNFGDWEGQGFDALSAADPELSRLYWEQPGDIAPPGGESWNQARQRIDQQVDQLCDICEQTDIICVSHFGAILTQLARAGGFSARSALSFRVDHLSVTCIEYIGDSAYRICMVNHQT